MAERLECFLEDRDLHPKDTGRPPPTKYATKYCTRTEAKKASKYAIRAVLATASLAVGLPTSMLQLPAEFHKSIFRKLQMF